MTNNVKKKLWMFVGSLALLAGSVGYVTLSKSSKAVSITEEDIVEFSNVPEGAPVEAEYVEVVEAEPSKSTASKYEQTGIAGVAQKEPNMFDVMAEADATRDSRPITLPSKGIVPVQANTELVETGEIYIAEPQNLEELSQTRSITMLTAPVGYKIIKTDAQYAAFKKVAAGEYPRVDFAKNCLVVLESKSNLPDNIFEITDYKKDGKKDIINFRVNIFGLDRKPNSHTYKVVPNTISEVTLTQVI